MSNRKTNQDSYWEVTKKEAKTDIVRFGLFGFVLVVNVVSGLVSPRKDKRR